MVSVLRSILPGSSSKTDDHGDDYNVEYSFAMEYTGPLVNDDIPQVIPIDVRKIPTAAMAARAVILNNLSLPIIQPIVKSDHSGKKLSEESNLGKFGSSGRVYSRKPENGSDREGVLEIVHELDRAKSSTSSGTLGFSNSQNDSNHFWGSEDVEDLNISKLESEELSSEISSCEGRVDVGNHVGQGNRIPAVTFCDLPSSDATSEESDDQEEPEIFPQKPRAFPNDGRKGLCNKCQKINRFSDKEFCIVCGAKYCSKCLIRAMGSMPEGRKCITCIGYRIDESKRASLGKCSRMLKRMLTNDTAKQIMSNERSCEVNQLSPHLICVNDKPLCLEELVILQSCKNPPKKLRPGNYWYDKVSGFWGKEGQKPSQIISAQLALGSQIREDASNGDTKVYINNREITKPELWMLKAAGIHCEGEPHFWVTADGSYQLEGMNYVMGKLWEKTTVRIVCAALSLPLPSDTSNPGGEDVDKDTDKSNSKNLEQKTMNKFLLVGFDQSGTSTIFKQAKILYDVPFSEDEKQNIKCMIQRNLYRYICILLEGHEHFETEYLIELRRQHADEPGTSGNLDAIFPAATREYSHQVEELWKDKAFQATYKRRNELPMLPRVANYFLDRAVEISRMDYEPCQMDILYAEGITSSNGIASMEFSFPKLPQDGYMEPLDQNDPLISYQLIRVHSSSLGENCKWLEMFEDVDLVIYSVSLTDYDEYYEDINGVCTNKMMASKKLFENIVTHPTFADKHFLLILNKFDLLEEKIEQVPLAQCEWFHDFKPVISGHPHKNNSNNNPPLAQRAFHYIAVKFKRLFDSLTGQKLFVSRVTGLEADTIDTALRYGREILKWDNEIHTISMNEFSSESIEPSTTSA
ncbi:hypothetical protein BUALT_Bualt19G0111800 [Buddleja alternifolia]|uniref:Extra-large guanine nucleotide-binding protein 1-like n=1 Tax=Buddleja alternifolia TaxID=168488 RepID=A0AAV6W9D3_9LAMI|nr:hypothetical protein BUALT_Bualt19G0111800 [Buddleja alternifolia]